MLERYITAASILACGYVGESIVAGTLGYPTDEVPDPIEVIKDVPTIFSGAIPGAVVGLFLAMGILKMMKRY